VIPSPSHPIKRHIIFGIKTRRFIDRINSRTMYVNRNLFKSCCI